MKNPKAISGQESKIPKFARDAREFAENVLAIGMPMDSAINAFLDSFPEYGDLPDCGLTELEIRGILRRRFYGMRLDRQRASYYQIKETQATLKKLLDCVPVASPFVRLIELEMLRQRPDLKDGERVRVLAAAAKEVAALVPREQKSPFTGTSLPDLVPKSKSGKNEKESSEGTQEEEDAFGGAMFKDAHKDKETPQKR